MGLKSRLAISAAITAFILPAACGAYSYGDPSAAEQTHLEAINRARINPTAEAARLGLSSLQEGVASGEISGNPVQPLAMNAALLQAARSHSNDMLAREYFNQLTLGSNTSPSARINAAGYAQSSMVENIGRRLSATDQKDSSVALALHDALFMDQNDANRQHRINLLEPQFREIGVGFSSGIDSTSAYAFYVTDDFALASPDTGPIVTGVVYEDLDSNGQYDSGEGRGGIPVTIVGSGSLTYTASAGGYGIPTAAGSHTLRFQGSAIPYGGSSLGDVDQPISVVAKNIKVDLRMSDFPGWIPGVTTSSTSSTTTSSTSTTTSTGVTTSTSTGVTSTSAATTTSTNATTTSTSATATTSTSTASTTTTTRAQSGAPVVRIVATPSAGYSPFSLTLDGAGSYDPDGGPLSYFWYVLGQPISTAPTIRYPDVSGEGSLTFSLTIIDNEGESATRSVTITVINGSCEPQHEIRNEIIGGDFNLDIGCDILVKDVVVGATSNANMNLRSDGKITLKPNFRVLLGSRFSAAIGN